MFFENEIYEEECENPLLAAFNDTGRQTLDLWSLFKRTGRACESINHSILCRSSKLPKEVLFDNPSLRLRNLGSQKSENTRKIPISGPTKAVHQQPPAVETNHVSSVKKGLPQKRNAYFDDNLVLIMTRKRLRNSALFCIFSLIILALLWLNESKHCPSTKPNLFYEIECFLTKIFFAITLISLIYYIFCKCFFCLPSVNKEEKKLMALDENVQYSRTSDDDLIDELSDDPDDNFFEFEAGHTKVCESPKKAKRQEVQEQKQKKKQTCYCHTCATLEKIKSSDSLLQMLKTKLLCINLINNNNPIKTTTATPVTAKTTTRTNSEILTKCNFLKTGSSQKGQTAFIRKIMDDFIPTPITSPIALQKSFHSPNMYMLQNSNTMLPQQNAPVMWQPVISQEQSQQQQIENQMREHKKQLQQMQNPKKYANKSSNDDSFNSPYKDCAKENFIDDQETLREYLQNVRNTSEVLEKTIDFNKFNPSHPLGNSFVFVPPVYQFAPLPDTQPTPSNDMKNKVIRPFYLIQGISQYRLVQYVANLRRWLAKTVVERVQQEFEKSNEILKNCGLVDGQIGVASLESLRKLAQDKIFVNRIMPNMPLLYRFLNLCPNQGYLVQRIKELASGSYMSEYTWNNVSSMQLPSDAAILFHLFCVYMDSQLNPMPQGCSERPFHSQYVIMDDGKSTNAELLTSVKNRQQCAIVCTDLYNPKFRFICNGEIHNCVSGCNNLFYVIIYFLLYLRKNNIITLEGVGLSRQGINIACIIEE